MPRSEENPLEGKGEEMLPGRGLPFKKVSEVEEEEVLELGELDETHLADQPVELAEEPHEVSERVSPEEGAPADEEVSVAEEAVVAVEEFEESRDLTPEEVAALFEEDVAREEVESLEKSSEVMVSEEGEIRDSGLGAFEPVISTEEMPLLPKEPTEEVAFPPLEAFQKAPPICPPPGPVTGAPGEEMPPVSQALAADADIVTLLVTEPELKELWKRADHLQQEVNGKISSLSLARTLLDQIQQARNEIMAGKDHYEEAERALNEVEYRVANYPRMERWSYTVGIWILVYEIIWALLIGLGMLYLPDFITQRLAGVSTEARITGDIVSGVNTMMWGGLGGVVGALYALWRHVARDQDFSKQYTMWYITNPIMGVTLGAFVFMVIRAGMFSLLSGEESQTISSAFAIYVLAWIAGFQQNVAYDIVRRVLRIFRITEEDE
ncbi:MAG: hypothetical protein AB1345_14620, partial [Chloroflexota bacterium]